MASLMKMFVRLRQTSLLSDSMGCRFCIEGRQAYSSSTNSKRRRDKILAKKETVIQYQGESTAPAKRVYVWGHARTGALGIGSYLRPEKRQTPVQEQFRPARLRFMDENHFEVYDLACGYGFTIFAMKKNRHHFVMGTGINTDSQLGYHEYPRKSGRVLDYIIQPVPISIPEVGRTGQKYVDQVACGRAHAIFLTKDGVYSQGNNAYGQCGHPIVEGEVFHKVSNIQKIGNLPDNIVKVVCGQDHSIFLTESGQVYSCGMGADGQTGLQTYKSVDRPVQVLGDIQGVKIIDVVSKVDCVLALSESGDVFGWGNSEYSQLSMVTDETQVNVPRQLPISKYVPRKIEKLAAGGSICAVVNDQGHVYVWGYGILGQGPKVDMLTTPSLLPPPLFGCNEFQPNVKVIEVKCGMTHFAACTDEGDIYTWGKGKHGCLGIQDVTVQYFPFKVSVPALAYRIECGVDHTAALCESFS